MSVCTIDSQVLGVVVVLDGNIEPNHRFSLTLRSTTLITKQLEFLMRSAGRELDYIYSIHRLKEEDRKGTDDSQTFRMELRSDNDVDSLQAMLEQYFEVLYDRVMSNKRTMANGPAIVTYGEYRPLGHNKSD